MKANKGFTLIELLAVIVVLAIIALIATPVVLSAIGTAREGANKESARGFVKAAEFYCATELLADNTVTTLPANLTGIDFKGTAPDFVPAQLDFTFDSNCKLISSETTDTINGYELTELNS